MRLCDAIFLIFCGVLLVGCSGDSAPAPASRFWMGEAQNTANTPTNWKQWQANETSAAILIPKTLKTQPAFTQLVFVQQKANTQPFRTDRALWGREDYWAPSSAFFTYGGDCEDYALAKLSLLRALGWPEDTMRVLLVQDMMRGIEHAVLWVKLGDRIYLLDNQSRDLLDAEKQTRYLPRYGMNALGFWRY